MRQTLDVCVLIRVGVQVGCIESLEFVGILVVGDLAVWNGVRIRVRAQVGHGSIDLVVVQRKDSGSAVAQIEELDMEQLHTCQQS